MVEMFEVGDIVRIKEADTVPVAGTNRFFAAGARGRISSLGAGDNYEVTFDTTSGKMLTVTRASNLELMPVGPGPEPSGYAKAAADHLTDALTGSGSISTINDRSVQVSMVFANLEIARQLGRIADALMEQVL